MRVKAMVLLALVALQVQASAQYFSLGTAQSFAVLGGSTVTNTGSSVIHGDLGVDPGSAVTGFLAIDGGPGVLTPPGTFHLTDGVALQAETDAQTAYNVLAGMAPNQNLTGQDLGGMTLTPGVYKFDSSAQLTGALTLNFLGSADAFFLFQIGSTLTTASASSVLFSNGFGGGCNVFWQVGSSATLGTTTNFSGNILASESITMTTGADIVHGSALALHAAVTMDTNNINRADCPFVSGPAGTFGTIAGGNGAVPEPGVVALLMGCCVPLSVLQMRRRLRR